MTTYTAKIWGNTYEIAADFSQASCPVRGDMHGRQVADFRHSAREAMKALLRETAQMGGDDPDECGAEIAAALDAMTEVAATRWGDTCGLPGGDTCGL